MAITMRAILLTAVPTFAALFGIFWFRRKKKALPGPEEPEIEAREDSVPRLILTQPSNEGLKVSEINVSEKPLSGIPERDEVATTTEADPSQEKEKGEVENRSGEKQEVSEDIKAECVSSCHATSRTLSLVGQQHTECSSEINSTTSCQDTLSSSDSQCNNTVVQQSGDTAEQVMVCTDHVEETMEQSPVSTVSKPVGSSAAVKHPVRDSEDLGGKQQPTVDSNIDSEKDESVENTGLNQNSGTRSGAGDTDRESQKQNREDDGKNVSHQHKEDAEMTGVAICMTGDRKRKCSDSLSWEESPSPELAASPIGNGSASTNGSETSGDSGIVATQPSKSSYQFNFPADLCGLLIGSRGKNIRRVMDQSGSTIIVKDKVYDRAHQLIVIEGSPNAVTKALEIIKSKFPKKKFPMIDWREAALENPILCSEIMQLHLPDGVHVDVIVSSVVALNHVFVQQPTHPTFPMLENQNTTMNLCYGQDGVVPQLPRPIEMGVICAAPMYNGWYRAQVVQSYPDLDEVDLRFVDYGGYCKEPGSALRQIRSDFTTLPFQAVECYLANVIPPKGAESFPAEANAVLEQLVQGQVLQAEVVGQEDDGVPYIQLYILKTDRLLLVNRELVDRGVASWAESA